MIYLYTFVYTLEGFFYFDSHFFAFLVLSRARKIDSIRLNKSRSLIISVNKGLLSVFHIKVAATCFESRIFLNLFFNGQFILNLVFTSRWRAETEWLFIWFSFYMLTTTSVLLTKRSAKFIWCLTRIEM